MLGNTKIFSVVIACPLNFHFFAIYKGLQLFFFLLQIFDRYLQLFTSIYWIRVPSNDIILTKLKWLNTTKHPILIWKMYDYNHTHILDYITSSNKIWITFSSCLNMKIYCPCKRVGNQRSLIQRYDALQNPFIMLIGACHVHFD